MGVRPGHTPLARPRRPRDRRRAGRRPPARGRAAPRGARRAGRHLGRLPDPAGAGPRDLAVGRRSWRPSPGRCGCPTPSASCCSGSPGLAAPGRDLVPTRITPSVQRLLDRLAHTPVAVYDAAWNLIVANRPTTRSWARPRPGAGSNATRSGATSIGPGNRAVHTPEEQADFESLLVADLRMTAARYPADHELKRLVAELTAHSPRFVELWESGEAGLAPGSVPAQDHRPPRRRTHRARLRHPHRRGRRPADHGLHRRARHRGRRTARTRHRPGTQALVD